MAKRLLQEAEGRGPGWKKRAMKRLNSEYETRQSATMVASSESRSARTNASSAAKSHSHPKSLLTKLLTKFLCGADRTRSPSARTNAFTARTGISRTGIQHLYR